MAERLRRAARRDEGLTLVELLVVMALLSGVVVIALQVLIQVQKQEKDVQGRAETVGQARLAVEQMDRYIRSGNVLYDPTLESMPLSMRVYTQANGVERCVQWQVYGGTLRTRSWSTTWQDDGLVSAWQVVARDVVNGDAKLDPATTKPFTLDSSSGFVTNSTYRLLNITLLVKDPAAAGQVRTVQTSLSGRNTSYGYDPGVCSPVPAP